ERGCIDVSVLLSRPHPSRGGDAGPGRLRGGMRRLVDDLGSRAERSYRPGHGRCPGREHQRDRPADRHAHDRAGDHPRDGRLAARRRKRGPGREQRGFRGPHDRPGQQRDHLHPGRPVRGHAERDEQRPKGGEGAALPPRGSARRVRAESHPHGAV
ncbi:MAG: hypothetical protein AVDCRST_MAG68-368, partial [uncultured Gemmatimonadetes bacterium]